jgi:hypothetical protein
MLAFYTTRDKFMNNGSVEITIAFSKMFKNKSNILYSPEDGPLGPKHVVIQREIKTSIKNS